MRKSEKTVLILHQKFHKYFFQSIDIRMTIEIKIPSCYLLRLFSLWRRREHQKKDKNITVNYEANFKGE